MTKSKNSEFTMKLKTALMRVTNMAKKHEVEIITGVSAIYTVMHEQGYTDEQIADFLCKDCRLRAEQNKEG